MLRIIISGFIKLGQSFIPTIARPAPHVQFRFEITYYTWCAGILLASSSLLAAANIGEGKTFSYICGYCYFRSSFSRNGEKVRVKLAFMFVAALVMVMTVAAPVSAQGGGDDTPPPPPCPPGNPECNPEEPPPPPPPPGDGGGKGGNNHHNDRDNNRHNGGGKGGNERGAMAELIPEEARVFLSENSEVWRQYCEGAETFTDALNALPLEEEGVLSDVLSDALAYVHETTNQARIYQEALIRLDEALGSHEDEKAAENEVDTWLKGVGYSVEHNQLRTALVRRIGRAAQNAITVIFVTNIATTLGISIQEWQVSFSASPSITVAFREFPRILLIGNSYCLRRVP